MQNTKLNKPFPWGKLIITILAALLGVLSEYYTGAAAAVLG